MILKYSLKRSILLLMKQYRYKVASETVRSRKEYSARTGYPWPGSTIALWFAGTGYGSRLREGMDDRLDGQQFLPTHLRMSVRVEGRVGRIRVLSLGRLDSNGATEGERWEPGSRNTSSAFPFFRTSNWNFNYLKWNTKIPNNFYKKSKAKSVHPQNSPATFRKILNLRWN